MGGGHASSLRSEAVATIFYENAKLMHNVFFSCMMCVCALLLNLSHFDILFFTFFVLVFCFDYLTYLYA